MSEKFAVCLFLCMYVRYEAITTYPAPLYAVMEVEEDIQRQ